MELHANLYHVEVLGRTCLELDTAQLQLHSSTQKRVLVPLKRVTTPESNPFNIELQVI